MVACVAVGSAGSLGVSMKSRTRLIQPTFFQNDQIAELTLEARLLFIGLWTIADKEGRLENRPKRIRAVLFPYDKIDICLKLTELADKGFVELYSFNSEECIQVVNWHRHQSVHVRETESTIQPNTNQGSTKASLGIAKVANPVSRSRSRSKSISRSGDNGAVVNYFSDYYEKKFKTKYKVDWGRDGKLVKSLLETFSTNEIFKLTDHLMETDDDYIRNKMGISIPTLSNQANKLSQQIARKEETPSWLK